MSTGKSSRKSSTKPQPEQAQAAEAVAQVDPGTETATEVATNEGMPEAEKPAEEQPKEPETETPPGDNAGPLDLEGEGPKDEEAGTMPSERTIGDLRKELSDKFPHAEFKELLEQMQMQLHRMPKHARGTPHRRVWFHVEVPVETVAFIEAWMPHLWPSRRSQN